MGMSMNMGMNMNPMMGNNFNYQQQLGFQNNMNFNNQLSGDQRQAQLQPPKKKSKKVKRLDPSQYTGLPLEKLAENIFSLAKDQGGCRYLQKLLDEEPEKASKAFYQPLLENILRLVNDPFGNYFIQKMFPTLNQEQLQQVIFVFSPHFFDIGANPHGTRVIQHLINYLSSKYLLEYFLTTMTPFIVPLLKELNGTHIVQKFAADYPDYAPFINKIIVENSPTLATHRHGCCVIQKYLETSKGEMLNLLLERLVNNCLMLIVDQFGNYVIQSILLMNNPDCGNAIAMRITENACYYAKHKYSSNVVEKCFDYCNGTVRQRLLFKLMQPDSINDLILDEHGNYVIQKVLSCVNAETQRAMLQIIVPLFEKLKVLPFGERIINRLLVAYPHLMNFQGGLGNGYAYQQPQTINKSKTKNMSGKNQGSILGNFMLGSSSNSTNNSIIDMGPGRDNQPK